MTRDGVDSLPEDLQQVVLDTAREVEEELWARIADRISGNVQRLKDENVTVVTDVPASFIDSLKSSGQQAIDEWKALIGEDRANEILAAYASTLAERQG